MGKKTQTKAGKASAPAKVPVKNSINLFIEEKHTGKNVAEIAIFAVFMSCAVQQILRAGKA